MMHKTTIKSVMVDQPVFISPEASLAEAAKVMKRIDCGMLPVGTTDHLLGILTDRDIVLRGVVDNRKPSDVTVKECMTPKVCSVEETESLQKAADVMHRHDVSRLVVMRGGKVSGVLSFGGILRKCDSSIALEEIIDRAVLGKKSTAA
jgi:CBS domain-containing protein